MTDEKNKPPSSSGKGFGGFGDLVSDVSKDIESATRESTNPSTPKSKATAPSTSSTQHTTAQTEAPRVNNQPVSPLPPRGGSGAKWFWGIGIVMVVLIAIGNSGKEKSPSHSPSPAYSPPPTYAPAATPETTPPPASVYSSVSPKEDKPPIGNGLALSRDQIRYCLSQKIRIDAIDKIVNTSLSGEVDSFNALVGDYNSRCSHFKYRRGSLEGVRAEVDSERHNIEAAAQHTWVNGTLGLESTQKKISTKPTPKELNSKKNQYPDQTQEKVLSATYPPSVGAPSLETDGTSSGKQFRIPANAVHNDYAPQGWLCKSKYKQAGNECRYVEIPENAVHNDYAPQGWLCKSKYKQAGNECRYVEIPENAVHNDYAPQGWLCKSGFRQNGSECWPVVPSN